MKKRGLPFTVDYEISNNEMIKKLVEKKLGISVLCSSMIEEGESVSGITIQDLKSHRHISLIVRKDRKISPPLNNFINYALSLSKNS